MVKQSPYVGFYPIIATIEELQDLIDLGVQTIQLRLKKPFSRQTIKQACTLARQSNIRLFINDHWRLAIEYEAHGVHLGQEDLVDADLADIRQANLQLGISAHNTSEVLLAQALNPSYIAVGPCFKSKTKPELEALTIEELQILRAQISSEAIAIGGIDLHNVAYLLTIGYTGIAVINALQTGDFKVQVKKWLKIMF